MPWWVEELETFLLRQSDVAGIVTALAENAGDGNGSRRFELIETSDGQVVAERAETGKRGELLETIVYLQTHQNGLMANMERKTWMMKGASEEIQNKFFNEVLDLGEKRTEVD